MAKPELGSQVPFFLNSFLSKPASTLPKGAQWVLSFDGVYTPSLNGTAGTRPNPANSVVPVTAILLGIRFEPQIWDIEGGLNTLLARDYQQTKGCLFAQAVQIPGESTIANPEGIQTNGFIRTFSGGGRNSFPALQISFLETNVSFVDNVLRPWTVATAHLGLLARDGEANYRGIITVYKLGVLSAGAPPYVACKYTFFGVCPIEVSGDEYTYSANNFPSVRSASFIYHYYTLETGTQLNPAIVNNTANYGLPIATNVKNYNVEVRVPVQ